MRTPVNLEVQLLLSRKSQNSDVLDKQISVH